MAEPHVRQVLLSPQWDGYDGTFGGKVIAELAAAAQCAEGFDLLSLTTEFLGAARPGAAEVEVLPRHVGRVSASVVVGLRQGHDRARASAKLARVDGRSTAALGADLRGVRPPEELAPFEPAYWHLPHCRLLDLRLVDHSGRGRERRTRVWLRLDTGAPEVAELDHAGRVAVLVDAVPPALFFDERAPAFVPTLDLSLHLRPGVALPEDGWCLAEGRLVWATEDFCLEDVTLYARTGEVLAQARQNRRIIHTSDL
ncbi:thioesterase family protein [Nocardioides pantholopis]|uniref:thioesterase family protein n=1 Tax=Nocardioides pantholopis TaxID=2483798 RepID=UPI000FD732C3|nr:thioesterase family protein [Nocardioides pantholopis]